ncbi:MAG: TlpA family protein disulfide reductase [Chloroflexi bacterium]|nr:MAG: TlpA family protein disulfide reductase [Chloroflexota bacterium]
MIDRIYLRVAPLPALALILAACTTPGQVSVDEQAPQQVVGGAEAQAAGNLLPSDIAISIYQGEGLEDGEEVLFSELLAQGRPVVLNFWAGLCPPCRLEMPDLQSVFDDYQDQVLLFGLDIGPFTGLGSRDDGRALLQELGISYPAGTTFDSEVVRNYEVLGMPSTYFITPQGEIVRTWTGLLTRDKLAELVGELLEASTKP